MGNIMVHLGRPFYRLRDVIITFVELVETVKKRKLYGLQGAKII